jgi:hypothetical protein
MLIRQIPLKHGINVKAVNIAENHEIQEALHQLGVSRGKRVIVLVGGASGIGFLDKFAMKKAVGVVAQLAEEMDAVVVDGGTQAGIMREIGNQRRHNKFSFPLIGVVFDNLLTEEEPEDILEPNHTGFILIPGDDWGDESIWIAKIATGIAESTKSITVLINGGEISQHDVQYSLMEGRPVFIMRGTGRLADEITLSNKVSAVDISEKTEQITESLREKLL